MSGTCFAALRRLVAGDLFIYCEFWIMSLIQIAQGIVGFFKKSNLSYFKLLTKVASYYSW